MLQNLDSGGRLAPHSMQNWLRASFFETLAFCATLGFSTVVLLAFGSLKKRKRSPTRTTKDMPTITSAIDLVGKGPIVGRKDPWVVYIEAPVTVAMLCFVSVE